MSRDSNRRKLAKMDRADRAELMDDLHKAKQKHMPEIAEDYSEKITIRITPREKQELLQRCQGVKVSSYIRAGLFDYPVPRPRQVVPIVTRQMYIELNRIGQNLNQQTRSIHEALKLGISLPIDHPEALQECIAKLDELKRILLVQQSEDVEVEE
jgi:hypothetical protein